MEYIFLTVICPACDKFVAHYTFTTKDIGKTWNYRCPNCGVRFEKRIPKKSNYNPELTG